MQRFNEVLQELLVFELTLLYILSYQLVTGVILPKTLCKNKGEWLKLRGLVVQRVRRYGSIGSFKPCWRAVLMATS